MEFDIDVSYASCLASVDKHLFEKLACSYPLRATVMNCDNVSLASVLSGLSLDIVHIVPLAGEHPLAVAA